MSEVVNFVILGIAFILFALVTYDLIKMFMKKRRNNTDEKAQEVSE